MNTFVFKCPHCGTEYDIDETDSGKEFGCSHCGKNFVANKPEETFFYNCPHCGTKYKVKKSASGKTFKCKKCLKMVCPRFGNNSTTNNSVPAPENSDLQKEIEQARAEAEKRVLLEAEKRRLHELFESERNEYMQAEEARSREALATLCYELEEKFSQEKLNIQQEYDQYWREQFAQIRKENTEKIEKLTHEKLLVRQERDQYWQAQIAQIRKEFEDNSKKEKEAFEQKTYQEISEKCSRESKEKWDKDFLELVERLNDLCTQNGALCEGLKDLRKKFVSPELIRKEPNLQEVYSENLHLKRELETALQKLKTFEKNDEVFELLKAEFEKMKMGITTSVPANNNASFMGNSEQEAQALKEEIESTKREIEAEKLRREIEKLRKGI